MQIYDRKKQSYIREKEEKEQLLNFLYNTGPGNFILKTVIAKPFFSKAAALYYKSGLSRGKIAKFGGDRERYKSFNEFFTRKQNVDFDNHADSLISPAQSKLLVYKINDRQTVEIKGTAYNVSELIKSKKLAREFGLGYCLVFRLSTTDYHRYIYIDDCELLRSYKIKGRLHTIRAIASKYQVLRRNSREVTILNTDRLGKMVVIEIGALTIGKIVNYNKKRAAKGEEKGYFEYGGSTIALLIKSGRADIDNDILQNSQKGIETKVDIGEKIGTII